MIVANYYRQSDEDPYRQAHPAVARSPEPDSLWDWALFIGLAIGFLLLIAWGSGAFDDLFVNAQTGAGR